MQVVAVVDEFGGRHDGPFDLVLGPVGGLHGQAQRLKHPGLLLLMAQGRLDQGDDVLEFLVGGQVGHGRADRGGLRLVGGEVMFPSRLGIGGREHFCQGNGGRPVGGGRRLGRVGLDRRRLDVGGDRDRGGLLFLDGPGNRSLDGDLGEDFGGDALEAHAAAHHAHALAALAAAEAAACR